MSIVIENQELFRTLTVHDRQLIVADVRHDNYHSGDIVFSQGESSHGLHWLVSGSIKAVRYRPDGKEILIHRISPGEVFAEVPSLLGAQYPVTAIAETNSQVATLPLSKLKTMIAARPELALALLAALADKLRLLVSRIEERTALSMPARIAHRLLEMSNNHWVNDAAEIELHQTKQSLAQECGTVSEVLSRTFANWKKQNLLAVDRSKLILRQRSKWEQIAADHIN